MLRGVGWIPVGLSGDAAIINRQSEGRASVHKGMAERSEIIEADSSPGGRIICVLRLSVNRGPLSQEV